MDDLTRSAFLNRPDLHVQTEGEFAGWRTWSRDNFESHNGPFWHRMEDDGQIRCAFRVERKHLNGMRNVHGGCFMTFADYCLFAFATPVLQGPGENAGVIDIGDGQAVVFKMESHNHPSYIEPYQGATTGVGGILRDVFTMGARPIACLDRKSVV